MKKFILALMLVALLPGAALAETNGIYVTPKLFYGYVDMDDVDNEYDWDYGTFGESSRENDSVLGGGLAIGYDFYRRSGVPIRAELEYSIFSQAEGEFSKGDRFWFGDDEYKLNATMQHDIQTIFFNVYWDINTGTFVTPYVGAGIGAAIIRSEGNMDEDYWDYRNPSNGFSYSYDMGRHTDVNLALNVGAGVAFHLTENLALDLGYRFVSLGKARTGAGAVRDAWYGQYYSRNETEHLYMHQVALGLRMTF